MFLQSFAEQHHGRALIQQRHKRHFSNRSNFGFLRFVADETQPGVLAANACRLDRLRSSAEETASHAFCLRYFLQAAMPPRLIALGGCCNPLETGSFSAAASTLCPRRLCPQRRTRFDDFVTTSSTQIGRKRPSM
jgi:hypothetical protein